MREFKRDLIIFIVFGLTYVICEIVWRGHSYFSMFLLGGLCGLIIGHLDEWSPKMNIIIQMIISSMIVVTLEFLFGYILNIKLGLELWDYSNQPFNILGQVCPQFAFLWFLLSYLAIKIDNKLRSIL